MTRFAPSRPSFARRIFIAGPATATLIMEISRRAASGAESVNRSAAPMRIEIGARRIERQCAAGRHTGNGRPTGGIELRGLYVGGTGEISFDCIHESIRLAAGAEDRTRLRDGLRQVRASTGSGSVCTVVEVAPWSRVPESRALLVPKDE